ncbi:hypothetical protein FB451DRAFT_1561513 [Mycena latifolia]|nr:hypothetical protein FB451DRAFT_1561513 [Mycena latifolia]
MLPWLPVLRAAPHLAELTFDLPHLVKTTQASALVSHLSVSAGGDPLLPNLAADFHLPPIADMLHSRRTGRARYRRLEFFGMFVDARKDGDNETLKCAAFVELQSAGLDIRCSRTPDAFSKRRSNSVPCWGLYDGMASFPGRAILTIPLTTRKKTQFAYNHYALSQPQIAFVLGLPMALLVWALVSFLVGILAFAILDAELNHRIRNVAFIIVAVARVVLSLVLLAMWHLSKIWATEDISAVFEGTMAFSDKPLELFSIYHFLLSSG